MTTETEIINQALGSIAARGSITNLGEKSAEARTALLYYADTRDALIRAAPWNFCRKTAYLTLFKSAPGTPTGPTVSSYQWLPSYPPPPWLYSYYYPPDCLRLRYVLPQQPVGNVDGSATPIFSVPAWVPQPIIGQQAQRFMVGTDLNSSNQELTTISCNVFAAIAVYNRRVSNVELWDPSFKQAMIDALAARICMSITGDKGLANLANQLSKGVMGTILAARTADGNEGLTIDDHIPGWLQVRGIAQQWTTGWVGPVWDNPSFLIGW
jgi:hypothetical protein